MGTLLRACQLVSFIIQTCGHDIVCFRFVNLSPFPRPAGVRGIRLLYYRSLETGVVKASKLNQTFVNSTLQVQVSTLTYCYLDSLLLFDPFPTLVVFKTTRILWAIPTAPVAPARRSKARLARGGVYGFYDLSREVRRPHFSFTWPVSTIRARAGRCREGGLSSTDERVRGHVTEVTQALWTVV